MCLFLGVTDPTLSTQTVSCYEVYHHSHRPHNCSYRDLISPCRYAEVAEPVTLHCLAALHIYWVASELPLMHFPFALKPQPNCNQIKVKHCIVLRNWGRAIRNVKNVAVTSVCPVWPS